VVNDIAVMMSEFVDNWPAHKRIETSIALIAKTLRAALNPLKHQYWGAGEPDCPRDIKAGNGELHTLRCKVCGQDNPRDDRCLAALATAPRATEADTARAEERENRAGGLWYQRWWKAVEREKALLEALRDEPCVLLKKGRGFRSGLDTVICGQAVVETYLRRGYVFDWEATDSARARTTLSDGASNVDRG